MLRSIQSLLTTLVLPYAKPEDQAPRDEYGRSRVESVEFKVRKLYSQMSSEQHASVNVQRKQKTYDGFSRLPEEFTAEDVVRCFNLGNEVSARKRINRLTKDHLIENFSSYVENGTTKAKYRKTGSIML